MADYPKNRASRTGVGTYCKPCHARITRANIVKNHGTSRAFHLKRRYGVDAVQVEWMILQQGGVCAVCGVEAPVHVDHDHATGAVRGVLCFNCNRGVSKLREDVALMRTAIDYLGTAV
jgi:hypothetical protein